MYEILQRLLWCNELMNLVLTQEQLNEANGETKDEHQLERHAMKCELVPLHLV